MFLDNRWIPDKPHRIAIGCPKCPNEALKVTSFAIFDADNGIGQASCFCWLCFRFDVFVMTDERFSEIVYPDPTVSHRNILKHLKRNGMVNDDVSTL